MKISTFVFAAVVCAFSVASTAQQSAASQPRSQRLLGEFSNATDLRAFALQAKTRPQEGGHFYARYVADVCGRDYATVALRGSAAVQKEIRTSGTIPSWQLAQMDSLTRRCAGFVSGEIAELLSSIDREQASNDPLMAAEQAIRAAARSGQRAALRSAVAQALALDDPLLWTSKRLWDAVAQSDPEARKTSGLYLNGVVYSASDGIRHLQAHTALELGFCKPGLPCALDDELRIICAAGGACAPDREAKAKSFYLANGGTEVGWRDVLALIAEVRTAVAQKNVGFFVR